MPSKLSTPRKLDQIKWGRGITDGDIRDGFFLELLNVEFDEGGHIRCRDGLDVQSFDYPPGPGIASKYVRLNGDPTMSHEDGWSIFLTTSTLYMYPYGSTIADPDSFTATLPHQMDLNLIEIVQLGAAIYISSIDPQTFIPNPVMSITWDKFEGRFTAPEYIVAGDDTFGELSGGGEWVINSLSRRPLVSIFSPAGDGYSKTSREIARQSMDAYLNADTTGNAVALYIEHQRGDVADKRAIGYTGSTSIEFVLVFIYNDGAISSTSTPAVYTKTLTDAGSFDIGVSVAVSPSLFSGVSQIRVYRKVFSGGVAVGIDHEFLFTAPMYDKFANSDTHLIPETRPYGNRMLINTGMSGVDHVGGVDLSPIASEVANGCKSIDTTVDALWSHTGNNTIAISYSHKLVNAGIESTIKQTAGWIKLDINSTSLMYMPPHFYSSGTSTLTCLLETLPNYISKTIAVEHLDCVRVFDRYNKNEINSASFTVSDFQFIDALVIGSSVPSPNKITESPSGGDYVGYTSPMTNPLTGGPDPDIASDCLATRGYFRMGPGVGSPHDRSNETTEGFNRSFVLFRDRAQLGGGVPSLEIEFGGVNVGGVAEVKPRHIGSAGGRLFGLNLIEDGVNRPSKMMYTEFGKFSSFRKDNYISYGVRDDGHGVAISTIKSYIIAHHSSSTYVFDISGGSDLVWREVGSFYDVGLISEKLVSVTPFGVFWCDRSHVWKFTGGAPESVSKEIQRTYRSVATGLDRMLYREDMKQIWITSITSPDIFIYDLDTGAWHLHRLDERDPSTPLIGSMFTSGLSSIIHMHSADRLNNNMFVLSENSISQFRWLIDTGFRDVGIPEVIKKIRRVYTHGVRDVGYKTGSEKLTIEAVGDDGSLVSVDELVTDNIVRTSLSVRGYRVRFKFEVKVGAFWRGYLDSVGVSYKMKNLK